MTDIDVTNATFTLRCTRHGCALKPSRGWTPGERMWESHTSPTALELTPVLTEELYCQEDIYSDDIGNDGTGTRCADEWKMIATGATVVASEPAPAESMIDPGTGVRYEPWTSGVLAGLRCTRPGSAETFVYFNPSSTDDDDVPTVFTYIGPVGDPAQDGAVVHHDLDEFFR